MQPCGAVGMDKSLKWFQSTQHVPWYLAAWRGGQTHTQPSRESRVALLVCMYVYVFFLNPSTLAQALQLQQPLPTVAAFAFIMVTRLLLLLLQPPPPPLQATHAPTPLKKQRRSTRELVVRKMAVRSSVTSIPIPSHPPLRPPPHLSPCRHTAGALARRAIRRTQGCPLSAKAVEACRVQP